MLKFLRMLSISLAVFAVGAAQVFGVKTGYFCECTGERSVQEICRADDCHPSLAHADGCGAEVTQPAQKACGDHDENSPPPLQHDHEHSEVRETLVVTGVPPLLALPAVVFFELPPTFQVQGFATLFAWLTGLERPEPAEHGSPPIPLPVARTMVMLV